MLSIYLADNIIINTLTACAKNQHLQCTLAGSECATAIDLSDPENPVSTPVHTSSCQRHAPMGRLYFIETSQGHPLNPSSPGGAHGCMTSSMVCVMFSSRGVNGVSIPLRVWFGLVWLTG